MNNMLPILLILIFGALSFGIKRWLRPLHRVVLFSATAVFFAVMALVDSSYRFPHLFLAILSAGHVIVILYPKIKPPGWFNKRGSTPSH